MEGFEVTQGKRGHQIPSDLGPSLGTTVKQGAWALGRRVVARSRGTCHFSNGLNPNNLKCSRRESGKLN